MSGDDRAEWPGDPLRRTRRFRPPLADDVSPVAERIVAVDVAADASYAVYGEPGGEPVLFQHPTPGSRLFARLLDSAAREVGVALIAVDRPGYGRTDVDRHGTLADRADRTVAVVDRLGHETVGVLGFGDGAVFALSVADRHPDTVTGLSVVGATTPPDLEGASPSPIPGVGDAGDEDLDRKPALDRRPTGTIGWLVTGILGARDEAIDAPRRVRHTDPETVLAWYDDPDRLDHPEADTAADVGASVSASLVEALEPGAGATRREAALLSDDWGVDLDLSVPTALLYGEADDHVPPSAGREFADRISGAGFGRVIDAGHLSALLVAGETALRRAVDGYGAGGTGPFET